MLDSSILVLGAANPLAALLAILFIAIPISALIGAFLLRAAVSMSNSLARAYEVSEPSLIKAFWIMLLVAYSNLFFRYSASVILAGTERTEVPFYLSSLVAFPFTFLFSSGLISGLLRTSFKRGMGILVCLAVILLLVYAVFFGIIFVVNSVGHTGS
ncbi:hypothetical protein Pan153_48140 [Gimesia panareensis]|uniref:Uncharacterized protein n=1 Tax=Gimesia panareensis TaxID=2527978 RepID=A0A518FUX3_9PLAN|nr:hypothetical protein [Gimesia panareensis]QDV20142.1 hypothetical protein Pan153_48140 [Gimesia panareensis]